MCNNIISNDNEILNINIIIIILMCVILMCINNV